MYDIVGEIYRYPTFYWIKYQNSWIPVIKWESIDKYWFISPNQQYDYIDEETNNLFPKTQLRKWDLIFTVRWLVWKVWYFDNIDKWNINANVIKIRLKDNYNSKFLWYYLNSDVWQKIIKSLVSWQVQQTITVPDILFIPIPKISLEIQNQIVEKMDLALKEKKEKEMQAKTLLESIDDFILSELWIEYKEVEEKKVFAISLNEVINEWRFDPLNFQKKDKHIEKTKYKILKLEEFAKVNKWQALSSSQLIEWNIPVIAWWQTSPYNHNIANYNWNIITISASWAYSWYVWYHNYPIFASDCSVIFSKDESVLKTEFLASFLKVRQNYIYSLQQWAWQPHVYWNDIENLEIPLPPLEIQEKIALEVKSRIEKAKVLESEAKEVYERTKREVEEMILD